MVTGAGGSIGSELCRQIVRLRPARLLLLEMSELALYNIERELQMLIAAEGLDVEHRAAARQRASQHRVREILQTYGVQTIYHAAAYKHVPIVEQNVDRGHPQQRLQHLVRGRGGARVRGSRRSC